MRASLEVLTGEHNLRQGGKVLAKQMYDDERLGKKLVMYVHESPPTLYPAGIINTPDLWCPLVNLITLICGVPHPFRNGTGSATHPLVSCTNAWLIRSTL